MSPEDSQEKEVTLGLPKHHLCLQGRLCLGRRTVSVLGETDGKVTSGSQKSPALLRTGHDFPTQILKCSEDGNTHLLVGFSSQSGPLLEKHSWYPTQTSVAALASMQSSFVCS